MTTIGAAGELGLLDLIAPYLKADDIDIGAGQDDAAAVYDRGRYSVLSTDLSVENVHFDLSWMSPEDAGWRALALALGDLAAKGATPWWALTSVAVPKSWAVDDFVGLFRGFAELAKKVRVMVVGGDMSAIAGPAVISITVEGWTRDRPLPRSEAKPGWAVAVTGPLGAAALALKAKRVRRIEPLLAEGRRLNELGLCCGDISDGLLREMQKFSHMSGAGCRLRAADIPVVPGATWEEALASGEEAELVCVGPEELVRTAGLRPLGVLTDTRDVVVVGADDMPVQPALPGYDHFG